jgi:OmpA-OmpF porin, OOP family
MIDYRDTFGEGFMKSLFASLGAVLLAAPLMAQDIPDAVEHPMVERYPGQHIRWQTIENFRPYRIPLGPVTGYRAIDDWVDLEGRVTRTFYVREGTDRGYDEVYLNFVQAFESAGFDIRAQGLSPTRAGPEVGGRQWMDVYLRENPFTAPGEVGTMAAGTSSAGGQGVFVAFRDRAAGPVWVAVTVEQHAEDYVGTLVDIVEVDRAETGLVAVDPEAIGQDLVEKGRVVLDGIYFDFDAATLQGHSAEALASVATYLRDHPAQRFFVVGHTDYVGSFDYNERLSQARAEAVVEALVAGYAIPREQLQPYGVGPLVPVFSNATDAGRERNRRVELVEAP